MKDIDQNMVQEISSYLPVEVHVASNIKVESAWVPVFNILKEPLLISNSKWGCFLDALASLDFKLSLSVTQSVKQIFGKFSDTSDTRDTCDTCDTRDTRHTRNAFNA